MDVKSKILLLVMFALLLCAIGYAYYNYVIVKNYEVIEIPEEPVE